MFGPLPARWNPARPGKPIARVEVWSRGEQVASVDAADLVSAGVKDEYKIGIRRSLTMTVEPSAKWLRWATMPGLEVRPYSGFSWGRSEFLCPMGRFPVLPPSISLPAQDIQFQATDYWQWVVDNDLSVNPMQSFSGATIRDAAWLLLYMSKVAREDDDSLEQDRLRATSLAVMPPIVWDKTASDAVIQAVQSIGAEAFMDRNGLAVIQDVPTVYGRDLRDGDSGTVVDISTTPSWSDVKNGIVITSSNDDHKFEPYTLVIEDPDHPAYPWRIGHKTFGYSSPLITTRDQAYNAAPSLLAAKAAPALSWSVTALFDPSVDAGDICLVDVPGWDPFQARVQTVTHDLAGDDMKLTLGAV